jgi:hypothetical protein
VEKKEGWEVPAAAFVLLLVMGGVVGEGMADSSVSSANEPVDRTCWPFETSGG